MVLLLFIATRSIEDFDGLNAILAAGGVPLGSWILLGAGATYILVSYIKSVRFRHEHMAPVYTHHERVEPVQYTHRLAQHARGLCAS